MVATSMVASSVHRAAGTLPSASPHARWSCIRTTSLSHDPGHCPTQPVTTRWLATSVYDARSVERSTTLSATGKSLGSGEGTSSSDVCCGGNISLTKCAASARGVGCSNMSVGESATPLTLRSCEESSVDASESMPASISGVSAVTGVDVPVTCCTTCRTAPSM
eukprot:2552698-Prymnesium_polylepis.2